MDDEEVLEELARFAYAHMREYGRPETILAMIRARDELGEDPVVPEYVDGMLEEMHAAGWDVDEEVEREIRQYMEDGND